MKKINHLFQLFSFITISLLIISCDNFRAPEEKMSKKCKCEDVDDCLSKYNFECARTYMSKHEANNELGGLYSNLKKITIAESVYDAKQGEYQKALDVISEVDGFYMSIEEKEEAKYTVLERAVDNFLEKGDLKTAKIWALKSSDSRAINGYDEVGMGEYAWEKTETQRKTLLKKIDEFQKAIY